MIQPDGLVDGFGPKAEAAVVTGRRFHGRDPATDPNSRQPDSTLWIRKPDVPGSSPSCPRAASGIGLSASPSRLPPSVPSRAGERAVCSSLHRPITRVSSCGLPSRATATGAGRHGGDGAGEVAPALHRLPVELRDDYIPRLEARLVRWAAGCHQGHQHTLAVRAAQRRLGDGRRELLQAAEVTQIAADDVWTSDNRGWRESSGGDADQATV